MRRLTTLFTALIAMVLSGPITALAADVPGSADHPLVGRFAGSQIVIYEVKDFDEYEFPLGPFAQDQKGVWGWSKSQRVEGKVAKITYLATKETSSLAVYRSYEAALKKAGFQILFVGNGAEVANYPAWHDQKYQMLFPNGNHRTTGFGGPNPRCLVARLTRPEGDVFASVFTDEWHLIEVDIVDVRPLGRGLVTAVTASTMSEGLQSSGRVALYTLYFDIDKAELKPESDPTLREIAKLLQRNAKLMVYIVGHTDNAGTLAHNVDLSQRRAEAVVKALTSKQGVTAGRVQSAGVGPLAPIALNSTEDGRAKNRRVELVAQ